MRVIDVVNIIANMSGEEVGRAILGPADHLVLPMMGEQGSGVFGIRQAACCVKGGSDHVEYGGGWDQIRGPGMGVENGHGDLIAACWEGKGRYYACNSTVSCSNGNETCQYGAKACDRDATLIE